MGDLFGQADFGVRLDWGPIGARAAGAEVSVIVDVLSFSTSVTVAVGRGMRVFPYRWKDARAERFAAEHDAVLAVGRLESTRASAVTAPSLSPAGLLTCAAVPRLVLPSPNGSTIAATLRGGGSTVAIGCLRNARATASWLASMLDDGRSVAVIAAGERWSHDDSLRPALEDHLGAGAILAGLAELGHEARMSPEARTAAELFEAGRNRLHERVHACVSGRELRSRGYGSDVDVAAELNVCALVPVLNDGAFEPAV